MIRHLTPAGYRRQPWANGRGVTVELARADGPDGLIWRLSMATVAEDGPFSLFPGIERNLTVISGPGFHLRGDGIALDARYAARIGLLPEKQADRLLAVLRACGLPTYDPALSHKDRRGRLAVLAGLEEFRAHLGGELTVTFPSPLGSRKEVHAVDTAYMADCIAALARK